jgi:hypothetical protein
VHIAVPDEAADVKLEIDWPSGQSQVLQPELNRSLTIVEPVKSL